ncbi:MAG: nitronate monooxygenase family protein [Alphaproteobacteria bacterium]|nr:nitronate monooxygenase family protein [Alphaproteobacteria bacterium]
MSLPPILQHLRIPVIASPMFIVSNPDLVIAQCKAGIVGSFPALNARPAEALAEWLDRITTELGEHNAKYPDRPAAPFAVNHIVHRSNVRLEHDLEQTVKFKVPIIITSLGAREDVYAATKAYGGITLHDIINNTFAKKAIEKGATGLIAVAAGAGGHAGSLSPFALLQEIREWFDGPVALSGSIANGGAVLAAQAAGADVAYIGSAFIATHEANAAEGYKQMIVDSSAQDILYTDAISGVHGNYLIPTLVKNGLDPKNMPAGEKGQMSFADNRVRAWKDIWGSGQGIGAVKEVVGAAELVDRLAAEYAAARARLGLGAAASSWAAA